MYYKLLEIISDSVINDPVSPVEEYDYMTDFILIGVLLFFVLFVISIFFLNLGDKNRYNNKSELILDVSDNNKNVILELYKSKNIYTVKNKRRDIEVEFKSLSEAREYIDIEKNNDV